MAWDVEAILKAAAAVMAPTAALVGVGGRRRRLRAEVRENLSLVEALEKNEVLREHTPAVGWLQGKVALDVARLAGFPLGTPKSPIPKGSVVMAGILGLAFAAWTYYIDKDGFVWYSVFPGTVSALMFIAILGMLTNRELPLDQDGELPEGATPVRTETATEQIMTSAAMAANGTSDRFADAGQVGVVFRFFGAMRAGRYEDGIQLAEENWLLCRVQAWLWNNQDHFGSEIGALQQVADEMLLRRAQSDNWNDFVETERRAFVEVWSSLNPDQVGAGSRRRRIARDYDLVVLAPTGNTGGYYVTTATILPSALVFVVHWSGTQWLLSNHIGAAPPTPGWPPAWWSASDPTIDRLP